MNLTASLSRRSLLRLFLVNLFFGVLGATAVFYLGRILFSPVTLADLMELALQDPETSKWAESNMPVFEFVRFWFYPGLAMFVIVFTLIQWLVLRGGFRRAVKKAETAGTMFEASRDRPEKDMQEREEKTPETLSRKDFEELYERYYLQLISVLQRNGRLLDFFDEDLGAYEDSQIGAAVRSIHETCAKTIKKTIEPVSVIDSPEGQQITVPADFDSSAIKLTGNVTGDPPFTGVLRHRGWRAGRLELPVLSPSGDPRIIAPAEVEIQ